MWTFVSTSQAQSEPVRHLRMLVDVIGMCIYNRSYWFTGPLVITGVSGGCPEK